MICQVRPYSSLIRRAANASCGTLAKADVAEMRRWDLKANILPEYVAANTSLSSVPTLPPQTEVTGSPQNWKQKVGT